MFNNRGFETNCEGCEDCEACKSFSRMRVSSCPLVPTVPQDGSEPSTVYGSLYNTVTVVPVITGTNVNFDTEGPSSGVTPDTVDDSITVNSSGIYTISFSTVINAFGPAATFHRVSFSLSINGTPDLTKETVLVTETDNFIRVNTLSRTDQVSLNQGDVIRIFINDATLNVNYRNSSLVVTKVG